MCRALLLRWYAVLPFTIVSGGVTAHKIANIVIPWQVLQELDYLKDNKHKKFSDTKAKMAQKYLTIIQLNHCFSSFPRFFT